MPRRPTHTDGLLLAVGLLALVVGLAPLLPDADRSDRSDRSEGALAPAAQEPPLRAAATAGRGRLTPALRTEIERVVDLGRTQGRVSPRAGTVAMVEAEVRCALLEGQRYCLGLGWTDRTETEVRDRLVAAADLAARPTTRETTGDLDALATLRRLAATTPAARAVAERAELTEAARSVAKVWLIRHQVQGVRLPDGFLEEHPEARTDATATTTATRERKRPARFSLMKAARTNEQSRTYWCGPATLQMIAWGWQKERRSQRHWAGELGTTTDGSAITELVRQVNRSTGYDGKRRAGPYVVLDVSDFSFRQWMKLAKRHLADYRAPLVLHPVLFQRFFPYLDDDASGHFQVGRGYRAEKGRTRRIGYFEPWNQQAFDPSEPFVKRVQWRNAYRSYRANLAHFQQNIGV